MNLKVRIISKVFGEKQIFNDFSFDFPSAGLYVISGDSGVGKTTLLRIISGLDKDFVGCVLGGGLDNTSFSFQEYRLFPNLSAAANIYEAAYKDPTATDKIKAKNTLIEFGFSEKETDLFPSELSGGMKQRVSLVRAFLKNSPILILDEPTKELDRELCERVLSKIHEESKKRLVIMVTHNELDLVGLPHKKIILKTK